MTTTNAAPNAAATVGINPLLSLALDAFKSESDPLYGKNRQRRREVLEQVQENRELQAVDFQRVSFARENRQVQRQYERFTGSTGSTALGATSGAQVQAGGRLAEQFRVPLAA